MRVIVALSLAALLSGCSADAQYFLGEIELEINGETIKHTRAWKCETKTAFRPADRDLFEQVSRQTPTPADSFVVKGFGSDHVVVFDNWMGCSNEHRRAGNWTEVSVVDSLASPTYGERLYLKAGASVTVQNPFENRFRTRLIRESVAEIDRSSYEASVAKSGDDGLDQLSQLRLKAAHGLIVDVLTWNDTDTQGLREGLALNRTVWEVERLKAPQPKTPPPTYKEPAVHNSSFIPLPLGYQGSDGKLSPPPGISVKLAGKVVELDERGFAEIQRPEPGIKLVRFYAQVTDNIWASLCLANPPPQCPKIPTVSR